MIRLIISRYKAVSNLSTCDVHCNCAIGVHVVKERLIKLSLYISQFIKMVCIAIVKKLFRNRVRLLEILWEEIQTCSLHYCIYILLLEQNERIFTSESKILFAGLSVATSKNV